MNEQERRAHGALWVISSPQPISSWALVLLTAVLLIPAPAFAQLAVKASASGSYQYNSNVFDLQTGFPVFGTNDYRRADSYYVYGGTLALNDQVSQQNLYLTAGDTELTYDHFTQLTHDEYHVDAGWNWRLGLDLDGTFDVLRSRTMVAFTEVVQQYLALDTEQRETANIGFQFLPQWRVEANGYTRKLQEPLPDQPNLQLTESQVGGVLKYGGMAALTSGLSASYSHGDFTATNGVFNPQYDQKTAELVATYRPSASSGTIGLSGRSTFDGAVGYSERTSPVSFDKASGLTGHLDYTNQLTGKTSAQVALDRVINSYVTNTGSEIDTSASATVLWQATYKTGISAAYTWTYRNLPDQGFIPGTTRDDHLQFVSLTVDYEPLRWLAIKPYANIQTRTSNYFGGNFNATVYGATFTVQWQNR